MTTQSEIPTLTNPNSLEGRMACQVDKASPRISIATVAAYDRKKGVL